MPATNDLVKYSSLTYSSFQSDEIQQTAVGAPIT